MGIDRVKKIGEMDAGVGEGRIDVVLCQCDGAEVIALQFSTWEEALGWQVQKTIPMAASNLRQLQRLLIQTRNQIEEQKGVGLARAQVIDLPLPGQISTAVELRSPQQPEEGELLTAELQG
jgi:hypothetical protein